ncbi:hypothetical protein UFOVP760_56 [uncultured Caudovirales phage]|uniref:Uncharacterized protein n=1 Tax=uncultured Caudovirales phage TaxID=2100421 RepID=A0A6J7X8R3_9CAUD|nr:hypothetical protein UFOVP760_56 [uncultured Caudovirales phage]
MNNDGTTFRITFQGIQYIVDVMEWNGRTSVYVEYADIDDDIAEEDLLKLTQYLVEEGFVEYDE